jgi:hypothetical protein
MDSTNIVELKWYGDKVKADVLRAARWGMDSVMADCVVSAKGKVPVKTTILQGSIQMRPTVETGGQLTGYWGSFSVKYARWVEEGTRPHFPPINAIMKSMRLDKRTAFLVARSISIRGTKPHPYLIPSAEQHYPSLPLRIRAQLEWGAK